jgi:hypothetical protein
VCRGRAAPGDLEDRAGLEVRDRAALEGLGREVRDRAGLEDLVGPDREDPEDLAGLEDTNRAALGVLEDMGLAAREGPANRVDLEDRVSPVDLVDTNRAVRGPRDRVRVARDLGQNRAHPGRTAPSRARLRRNLPGPDLTRARRHRMPAHLHLTQALPHRTSARPHRMRARLREPTHPGVATHLPVRTRQAEAIHPVAATPVAATHPGEAIADTEGAKPRDCEFIWHSRGFGRFTQLCI